MRFQGWNELQDGVTLVGNAIRDTYSAHDVIVRPFEDLDWSLFAQSTPGLEHLATKKARALNDNASIECEIQPSDGCWSLEAMHQHLDPMFGNTVTVTGTWVEDLTHSNKTEIHPTTSIMNSTDNASGVLTKTERLIRHCVFDDTSEVELFCPRPPPHANERRALEIRIPFTPSPEERP